ncbi:MAG: hypothetical protein AAF205_01050 [Pseudomonadota bacterium]
MTLEQTVTAELAKAVDPRVAVFAAEIAARHPGSAGVLFYGSCLREAQLDGLMLDFYLIVEDYARAYDRAWLARANALLPPNVFHAEHDGLVAKYAVLSQADLARETAGRTRSVSVWARFSQPSRLVWSRDREAAEAIGRAVAAAPATLMRAARPLLSDHTDIDTLWGEAFALTYAAELRAEKKTRATGMTAFAPAWYRSLTGPALLAADISFERDGDRIRLTDTPDRKQGRRAWSRRRRDGKAISIARLAKAVFTFDGGIDYLAWKINRHADAGIEITPWQRRHPILAGIGLLPKLLRSGAVK